MKLTNEDLKSWGVKNPDKFLEYINEYSEEFKVNTPNRMLCFWANVLHESANLFYMRELASGAQYEGRKDLGNTKPGDGRKFAGRGILQVTGRFNYNSFTEYCKHKYKGFQYNFVTNPELLETPRFAVLAAFWFWERNSLEVWADAGKFKEVCAIINTGKPHSLNINGWDKRLEKYKVINDWLKKLI